MSKETYYTPGVCNLNQPEVAYRRKAGYAGLVLSLLLVVGLGILQADPLLGLLIFPFAWVSAIGFLQAKYKFCVGYAASGIYNSGDDYAETQKIVDAAKRKLDQARARSINVRSFVSAIIATTAAVVLLIIVRSYA